QVKVYNSIDPRFVPDIARAAHARGLRFSGHVPNGMTASQFVVAGADEIQHIPFLLTNFMADKIQDTRTGLRAVIAEYASGIDFNSPAMDDFIELLKSHGTTLDLTLAVEEDRWLARPGTARPILAPVFERLPVQAQRFAYSGGAPLSGARDR